MVIKFFEYLLKIFKKANYKIDSHENLLYSTGNSSQCSVVNFMGRKSKNNVRICITGSLCYTVDTNTTL